MNKRNEKIYKRIAAADTLVIVLDQSDKNHCLVLRGNAPLLTAKRYTRGQIINDSECHWSSDCGMYDIRNMISFKLYSPYLKHYPHEALVPLSDFLEDSHIRINHWMPAWRFKETVFSLSDQMADSMPDIVKEFHRYAKKQLGIL